jgi:hypothetical protein
LLLGLSGIATVDHHREQSIEIGVEEALIFDFFVWGLELLNGYGF